MQKTKEWTFAIEGKLRDRFLAIKEHTGMKSNKNVLAFLISDAYDKIQDSKCRKIFVANETYELIEKKAAVQGQSVDVFVAELIGRETRKG